MTSSSGAPRGRTTTSNHSSSRNWSRNLDRWPTTVTTSMTSCTSGQLLTFVKGMRFIASVLTSSTNLLRHVSITSTIKYRWGGFMRGAATMVSHFFSVCVQCSRNHFAWTAMCRYVHAGNSRRRSSAFTFSTDLSLGMVGYRPAVHCPHIGYVTTNIFGYYTNLGNSPSGGGMCIKRDVCISLSLAVFYCADIFSDSISPKQPKICTRGHSCRRDWVRCLRDPPLHLMRLDVRRFGCSSPRFLTNPEHLRVLSRSSLTRVQWNILWRPSLRYPGADAFPGRAYYISFRFQSLHSPDII